MFTDFIIKYDPKVDTLEDVSHRIFYSIFIRRMKHNKPVITFIGGDSGEGKSYTVLKIQEVLLGIQGIDLCGCVDLVNVYTPLEYPEKMKELLYNKEFKKINVLAMHESRDIIKAKMWQSFLTTAVSDINAQMRSVKRLAVFVCSQFIRDITADMRYGLNYYATVNRPLGGDRKVRLRFYVMWKDDRDLEKPRLRKRRLSGYLVYPSGRRRRYTPRYFLISKPSKEVIRRFEESDRSAKEDIIRSKLDRLMKELKMELGVGDERVNAMVNFYASNLDQLGLIGKRRGKKFKLTKNFRDMFDLSDGEIKLFESRLVGKLRERGMLEEDLDGG